MICQQRKKCPEIFHCIGGWLLAPHFPLGQSKARPAYSGGDLLCLDVKPAKHMHLFTFQNHFITKMNKRRMLFKLNKLHKHRESRASPGIPSSQVSITKNIQKYWNSGLFHYLALLSCLSHVQTMVYLTLLGFFSKSSSSEVFVKSSLSPNAFPILPPLSGHLVQRTPLLGMSWGSVTSPHLLGPRWTLKEVE